MPTISEVGELLRAWHRCRREGKEAGQRRLDRERAQEEQITPEEQAEWSLRLRAVELLATMNYTIRDSQLWRSVLLQQSRALGERK
jgi:hypothetical protein